MPDNSQIEITREKFAELCLLFMYCWNIAHMYLFLIFVGMVGLCIVRKGQTKTSDFKYSDCQRMLRPIEFTVLELNYNFQMLTIQIRFYNSRAKALVHILILSCFAFYFAFVTMERS